MTTTHERKTLAVDIDDTIADTVHHFVRLLDATYGNPEGLSPDDTIKKYRIVPNMKFWQTPEIIDWLREKAYDNKEQAAIPPVLDARDVLIRLENIIDITYITTRPIEVKEGTLEWLIKNDFPKGELIMNSAYDRLNGNAWKAKILESQYPKMYGLIDDNPEIIINLSRQYKGVVYLYGTATLPMHTMITVNQCKDWADVERMVLRDCLL